MLWQKSKFFYLYFLLAVIALTSLIGPATGHADLLLEGQFFEQGEPVAEGAPMALTLRIYDDEISGTLLFAESQEIKAGKKLSAFTFEKGEVKVKKRFSGTPAASLWVEVEYEGEIMNPRLNLAELGSLNDLTTENTTIREAHLRTAGTATLVIDDNGVTLGGLLDMGTQSIKLNGKSRNEWLTSRVAALESDVAALKTLLHHFTRNKDDITISGANLHIVNGTGTTDGPVNGKGNLIVGYNEERGGGEDNRTGSHNIVGGKKNNYSSYGGLVAGYYNTISNRYSSVSGGTGNMASGLYSSVSGGTGNKASADYSSVSGGWANKANGYISSISGGKSNEASGDYSSVSGGCDNTASGDKSSVSGGYNNTARGVDCSVSGGHSNESIGVSSSVSGGYSNTAFGFYSSVSGGYNNTARGQSSSVSGGQGNTASGDYSSVSGGHNRSATGQNDWAAGSLYENF